MAAKGAPRKTPKLPREPKESPLNGPSTAPRAPNKRSRKFQEWICFTPRRGNANPRRPRV
eukprot:4761347-Pyramimonas_sp.AAC.1